MERFAAPLLAFTFLLVLTRQPGCRGQTLNPVCSGPDRRALIDFKNGLNDPESRLSSWQGSNCCEWRGISCDNTTGAVISIDLHNPYPADYRESSRYGFWNLSGEIRPSLVQLKSLQYLDLSLNTFGQIQISAFLGSLKGLQYLNLSEAGFSGPIPASLGNLSRLQTLDISSDLFGLTATTLDWLSGLVSLKHLAMNLVDLSLVGSNWASVLNLLPLLTDVHLSGCSLSGPSSNLDHVNFTSLSVLDLGGNSFNSLFPSWLLNISSLTSIDLSMSSLYGRIPLGLSELPNLQHLNLEMNDNLSASCYQFFQGSWPKIEDLILATNKLHGRIPSSIGNMTYLTNLNLFVNAVEGGIPSSISKLCNLRSLNFEGNNLTGSLPEVLEPTNCIGNRPLPRLMYLGMSINHLAGTLPEWLGQLESLLELSLDGNSISGPIPSSLGNLRNLTNLSLGWNRLNGTLPDSLGQLSQLSNLVVSSNDLSGFITEAHFEKLNNLQFLYLDSNSLVFNVSPSWIPPFQIHVLNIGSCNLGPSFPNWIRYQRSLGVLNIANASISDAIPDWLWETSSNITLFNVSFNQLHGQVHRQFSVAPFADVDFSSNLLEGPLPLPAVGVELLDLSSNKFSGPIPQNISETMPYLIFLSLSGNKLTGIIPDSVGDMSSLQVIDLSNNSLTGTIPASISNCSYLKALDFSSNNLSGTIPSTVGQLTQLQSLHLTSNCLTGHLPPALRNLSSLETFDLGYNRLSGRIPSWFDDHTFPKLRILSLRYNSFSGAIPSTLSNLSSLQILDLAGNNLTGTIPTALGDLKSMSFRQNLDGYLLYARYRGRYYQENYVVNMKGGPQKYTKTLSLVNSIDLSSNNLHGDFPEAITKLQGLVALNLSENQITNQIPDTISNLRDLSSLDLSNNQLSGTLPTSMTSLTFLSSLNLSNNNFSGTIPVAGQMGTFGASSFAGNPFLCGAQVGRACQADNSTIGGGTSTSEDGDHKGDSKFIDDESFFMSLGLGFAAGLLVPMLVMAMLRPWRKVYFGLVNRVATRLRLLQR